MSFTVNSGSWTRTTTFSSIPRTWPGTMTTVSMWPEWDRGTYRCWPLRHLLCPVPLAMATSPGPVACCVKLPSSASPPLSPGVVCSCRTYTRASARDGDTRDGTRGTYRAHKMGHTWVMMHTGDRNTHACRVLTCPRKEAAAVRALVLAGLSHGAGGSQAKCQVRP